MGVAYGKDNAGNDRWIIVWDRGDNLASVASVAVPSASGDWTTLDMDAGGSAGANWTSGNGPNGVAFTNSTVPPVWAIVGGKGHVAYSSTGSSDPADWRVDINTTTGFASNRGIEAVAFSGSYLFLAGARTRIVSGSVVAEPSATAVDWGHGAADTRALDEDDTVGNSQFNWFDIGIAGLGANGRIITVLTPAETQTFL